MKSLRNIKVKLILKKCNYNNLGALESVTSDNVWAHGPLWLQGDADSTHWTNPILVPLGWLE